MTQAVSSSTARRPPGHGPPVLKARRRRLALELLVVFALGGLLMLSLLGSFEPGDPGLPGYDSFYHVKMALLLPEVGLIDEFPWLEFVYFREKGDEFVSHHYGFHLLLVPFVYAAEWLTGNPMAGGRWAVAFFFGLNLALFDLFLIRLGVRWRWVWLVLFVCMPGHFFSRNAYVRAIGASLAFLQILVLLLIERRHRLAALTVALYVQLYLGAVMYAPVVVAMYAAACVLAPREQREWPVRMVAWTAAAWLAGVLLHPYAAGMAEFLRVQVLGSGLSPDIEVGREWKPYEGVWWFATASGTVLVVWVAALFARLRTGPPISRETFFLLLVNLVFLVLTLKSRRFVEYWPLFCLLASAALAKPLMAAAAVGGQDWLADLPRNWQRLAKVTAGTAVVFAGAMITLYSPLWVDLRRGVRCYYDLDAVRDAMTYLKEHSAPGDVVFTDDWDVFPVFFYYNHHNHYIVGLDPKFTHARKPDLWQRYVRITRGQTPAEDFVDMPTADGGEERIAVASRLEDIRDHFGARFVIIDREHHNFARKLLDARELAELVYPATDFETAGKSDFVIFRIRD